jgi:hypothetical protein
MMSIGARLERAVNRVGRRRGPVLDGRYHHRSLRSPREVRRALAYVLLLNARRHLAKSRGVSRSATAHLDGASSARWFDGFRPEVESRFPSASGTPEVARPRTWLLRVGWGRHGLVDPVSGRGRVTPTRYRQGPAAGSVCRPWRHPAYGLANTLTGFTTLFSGAVALAFCRWIAPQPARWRFAYWMIVFFTGMLLATGSNEQIVYPFFAVHALWHVVGAFGFVALWAFNQVRFAPR